MLEQFILDGRTLESAILYGSEPPAVETYWRNATSKGWKVNPFQRSMHNKKEKEVDCAISVGITKTGGIIFKSIEYFLFVLIGYSVTLFNYFCRF